MLITAKTWVGRVSCYANDWFIAGDLARGDTFEGNFVREVLAPFVRRARYVLDIGAHVGMHTLAYAHLLRNVDGARIFAFEPQSALRKVLAKNLADNGLQGRVTVLPFAVGHVNAITQLSASISDGPNADRPIEYGSRNAFNLGGLSIGKGGEPVRMRTLDSMAFQGCNFLKIDVEGFEPLVLLGAMDLLRKHRPVVVYENIASKQITPEMIEMFGLSEVPSCASILSGLGGYRIHQFGCNYLALPDGLEALLPAATGRQLEDQGLRHEP
jgi:FkbM family methyltransferase